MAAATRLPPTRHPGVTVGIIADEEEAKAFWFCDDMDQCHYVLQLDVARMVESHGREAMIDDVIGDDVPCPNCGGPGHMTLTRKRNIAEEHRAGAWMIAGLLAGAAFMFFGAFYNFDQMSSGGRFRPFQLIVCIPLGLALLYFAGEIWKGMREDNKERSV